MYGNYMGYHTVTIQTKLTLLCQTDVKSGCSLCPCFGGIPNFNFTVEGDTPTIYGSLFEGEEIGTEAGMGIAYCQAGVYFGDDSFMYAGLAVRCHCFSFY